MLIPAVSVELSSSLVAVRPQLDPATFEVAAQLRATFAEKPEIGVKVAVVEAASPATTVPEVGLRLNEKSTPFPVMVAVRPL
jgi:hypothetical protein